MSFTIFFERIMVYHHPKGSPTIFDNKNGGDFRLSRLVFFHPWGSHALRRGRLHCILGGIATFSYGGYTGIHLWIQAGRIFHHSKCYAGTQKCKVTLLKLIRGLFFGGGWVLPYWSVSLNFWRSAFWCLGSTFLPFNVWTLTKHTKHGLKRPTARQQVRHIFQLSTRRKSWEPCSPWPSCGRWRPSCCGRSASELSGKLGCAQRWADEKWITIFPIDDERLESGKKTCFFEVGFTDHWNGESILCWLFSSSSVSCSLKCRRSR